MIAFTWQRSLNLTTGNTTMVGVRLLDTAGPGDNLMDLKTIVSSQLVRGTVQSALITPDGATSSWPSLKTTVQAIQFGWLDVGGPQPGRFTPPLAFKPGQQAFWAAW